MTMTAAALLLIMHSQPPTTSNAASLPQLRLEVLDTMNDELSAGFLAILSPLTAGHC